MSSVLSPPVASRLERHRIDDLSKTPRNIDDALISDVIATLYRTADTTLVRDAMIERYAKTIRQTTDDNTGATTTTLERVELYDQGVRQAILAGQQEITRCYAFDTIARHSANLFGAAGSRYEYDIDGVGETMEEVREDGNALLGAQRWDALACACGSSILNMSVSGGVLHEQEVPVNSYWFAHAPMITEADGTERVTNVTNLDEASVVAMSTGRAAKTGSHWFAAWFGPSEDYPLGRHVMYEARQWYEIPDVGEALEHTIYGFTEGASIDEISNPLSQWAEEMHDYTAPVYPFSILYYDPMSTGLMPTSTTLYEVTREFDLAYSLILSAAGKGARGVQAMKNSDGMASTTLPDTVSEGMVILGRGWELSQAGWSPTHAKAAAEVVDKMILNVANAFSIPSFLVLPETQSVPSGIALEIMTLPMLQFRQSRINLNRGSVRRRFDVERALINSTVASDVVPVATVETWIPGELEFPRDPVTEVDSWVKRIDKGEADIADMAMDLRGIESREAFWNLYDEHKAERAEHGVPDTAAPAQAQGGIASRMLARRQ